MTGQLELPPVFRARKFWPRAARIWAELVRDAPLVISGVEADPDEVTVTVTFTGGVSPVQMAWGDGSPVETVLSPAVRQYATPGVYDLILRDGLGQEADASIDTQGNP